MIINFVISVYKVSNRCFNIYCSLSLRCGECDTNHASAGCRLLNAFTCVVAQILPFMCMLAVVDRNTK